MKEFKRIWYGIVTFHAAISHLLLPMRVSLNKSVFTIPGCTEYTNIFNDSFLKSLCNVIVDIVCANLLCPYDACVQNVFLYNNKKLKLQ